MPQEDKTLHIVFEIIAVFILVPFFIYLLNKHNFNYIEKTMLILIIIGTLLVDGYLLFKWIKQ
jgi:hypothetical protein